MGIKIFISPSNQNANTYASGGTNEYEQCKQIGLLTQEALNRCGFETMLECEPTMQVRVAHSDAWGADMHLAIHTNAAGSAAGGTQVYYGQNKEAAAAVFNALAPITPGSSAEVYRQNSGLYEVSKPKAISVYVEAEFHHVKSQAQWIVDHKLEIAEAICKGICVYYKVKYVEPAKPEKPAGKLYRVQVGAFSVKENADAYVKKLKADGYDAFIVEV